MNIGIDLRALVGSATSGVTVYLNSVLEELFKIDKKNNYFLWWNSAKYKSNLSLKIPRSPRFKFIRTNYSNRWLNFKLKFGAKFYADQLISPQKQLDLFWLPDPRPVVLSPSCKLITTVHDLSPTLYPKFFSFKTRLWHKFLKPAEIARRSDRLVSVSKSTAEDLQEIWDIPKNKIVVTKLGVAKKNKRVVSGSLMAKVRKKYNLPAKFVLSLSTLEPRKNLRTLITAFKELKEETDLPHSLVLAGRSNSKIFANPGIKSPSIPLLKRGKTNGERQEDFLHLPGFIAEEDKAAVISMADAFCFPSHYEGFGLPALEALACGTPLLASDIPALHEVAGHAAIFSDPRNTDAWKISLQKVLTNKSTIKKLSSLGIKQAAKFSWRKTAKETLKAFEECKM